MNLQNNYTMAPSATPNDGLTFLTELFRGVDPALFTYISLIKNKGEGVAKTMWFPIADLQAMAVEAVSLAGEYNVYFGPGLTGMSKDKGRAKLDDICCVTALWGDVDVKNDIAHKEEELPETIDAAVNFLLGLPKPPSLIVDSGYGLQPYWLLDQPAHCMTQEARKHVAAIAGAHQRYWRKLAFEQHGWNLDPTHDLTRILRLIGTKNRKDPNNPKSVKILYHNERRYSLAEFIPHLDKSEPSKTETGGRSIPGCEPGPAAYVVENCELAKYCHANAGGLTEPYWHTYASITAHCSDGREAFHELSKHDPRYDYDETENKFRCAEESSTPHTCAYIQNDLGFKGCPIGGCGVKSPAVHAVGKLPKARAIIKHLQELSTATVYEPEILGALAVLHDEAPADYEDFRKKCKSQGIRVTDLDRYVKKHKGRAALRIVTPGEIITTAAVFNDVPFDGRIPQFYEFSAAGVIFQSAQGPVRASPVPVIIAGVIQNRETNIEKILLYYRRGNVWKRLVVPRSIAFDARKILTLADCGLPVSSETARYLVKWLDAFYATNMDSFPVQQAVSSLGWHGDTFRPGAAGDLILDLDDAGGLAAASGYCEVGTLQEWITSIQPVRRYPIARLLIAAAFAAPLLKILGQRVFVVHAYGPSRGGKTAAQRAAVSAWGDPEALTATFNATLVALERTAALYTDLPLAIDERQAVGNRQGLVDGLVYMLGGGKGRLRGSKTGLQNTATWRTIAITNGEQPLSTDSGTAGIRTRVLEFAGKPIPDEAQAAEVYRWTRVQHGTAGPEFIRRLLAKYPPGRGFAELLRNYDGLRRTISKEYPETMASQRDAVITLTLADCLYNELLEGMTDSEASSASIPFALEVLKKLETAEEASDASRAWEFIHAWLATNNEHFQNMARETYGTYNTAEARVYIIAAVLDKALREAGFEPRKVRSELAEAGHILTFDTDGKKRFVVQQRVNGARPMCYVAKWASDAGLE